MVSNWFHVSTLFCLAYRINCTTALIGRHINIVHKVHLDLNIVLLHHKDRPCHISSLSLLRLRQFVNTRVDEEDIGEVVDFLLAQVGDLVNIAMHSNVPTLVGPIAVWAVP